MSFLSRSHSILLITCFLVSCTPTIDNRGYEDHNMSFAAIKPHHHTKQNVLQLLGSPSTASHFQSDTWYYISKITSSTAFFKSKTLSQRVVAIHFTPKGLVDRVVDVAPHQFTNITMNPQITPTYGQDSSLGRDIFSNFGRMSSKKPSTF